MHRFMVLKYLILHVIFGPPIWKIARILKPNVSVEISKVDCFRLNDAVNPVVGAHKTNISSRGFLSVRCTRNDCGVLSQFICISTKGA